MSKAYGFNVPLNLFETTNVQLSGERGAALGLRLTNALVVTEVQHQTIAHQRLMIGDIIQSMNGQRVETRAQFVEAYNKMSSNAQFSIDIVFMRPLVATPIKPSQIPRGYEVVQGCKYHTGVMFKIPGCKLSLSIKAYMSKVFVTRTEEGTLAGLTLKIGDAILDIEGLAVSTVQEASEALFKALKAKGYATMVIEQPVEMVNKNIVRQALTADRSTDPPPQRDVALICQKELKRFQENPDTMPKSVLKDRRASEAKSVEVSHVTVSDKSEDVPIACDGNPNLLIPVPVVNFQIQTSQVASPASTSSQQKQ